MIIGICVLAIVLVSIIVIIDKKGIKKRKMMAQKQENKETSKAFRNDDE